MDFLLAGMVRSGFIERSRAIEILSSSDLSLPPPGFPELMEEIGCREDILSETEGRSALDYPGRHSIPRRIAGLLRKALH